MTPALIHAVVRVADARTSDTELLKRFVHSRDEHAFEELVCRHGPLVWSVCRQMLPHHADAEDAFQAVFLALIQGAGSIRSGQVLPAWLHGVAVRIAEKTKRASCRRRTREARAAVLERDQPVPDTAWAALMTAVHEEVQCLPEQERTAFVLCDLQGVRQSDAATRLGWPLGTLSGRLCKARQRLIDQLSRRGVVPAVLAIGGLAGTTGEVPASLAAKVSSFPLALADGISSTVASLARGVVGGATMRTKMIAAAILLAGALGFSGASMFFSNADAQADPFKVADPNKGTEPLKVADPNKGVADPFQSSGGGQPGAPGGSPVSPSGQPPGQSGSGISPTGVPGGQPPGVPGSSGGAPIPQGLPGVGGPGPMAGGPGRGSSIAPERAAIQWDYKFIDMKGDDRDTFEKEIRQAGSQGWEFCGSEHLRKGNENKLSLVLVFKKRHGGDFTASGVMGFDPMGMPGMGPGMPTGPGAPGMRGAMGPGGTGPGMGPGRMGMGPGMAGPGPGPGSGGTGPGMPPQGPGEMIGNPAGQQPTLVNGLVKLKHTDAVLVATALNAYLKGQNKEAVVVAEPVSNTIVVAASPDLYKQLTQLISDFDGGREPIPQEKGTMPGSHPGAKSTPAAPGPGGPMGAPPGPGPGGSMPPPGLSPSNSPKPGAMPPKGGVGTPRGDYSLIKLKHATAAEMAQVLKEVFPQFEIAAYDRTNQLIIQPTTRATTDEEVVNQKNELRRMYMLIDELDVEVKERSK